MDLRGGGSNNGCQWCMVNCVFEHNLVLYNSLKAKSQGAFAVTPSLCENCFLNREQSCKSDVLLPLISVKHFDQKVILVRGAAGSCLLHVTSQRTLFSLTPRSSKVMSG